MVRYNKTNNSKLTQAFVSQVSMSIKGTQESVEIATVHQVLC